MSATRETINDNKVALLAEGVDRNAEYLDGISVQTMSPSSRRAWIEIRHLGAASSAVSASPSSRRAWIEIAPKMSFY